MNYQPVIGLEVHIELKTKSKMFCCCSADYFGHEPNTHTCPVCLGLPGALPVPNTKAVQWCIMIGISLNCTINMFSKFDRKNYFYPDLPKGYQISQYDQPFCQNGFTKLSGGKKIRIRRVHMEEDTGKLLHTVVDDKNVSLIDYNRSGVPLVEIVTEPDFDNAKQVVEYLQKLQQIVRYLDVSNADMEKGDMRLEPNISLKEENTTGLPIYKVEVKNINSFKFVEKAIGYELNRQNILLKKRETPDQETRGWDEKRHITVSQRLKEEAHDYRYFPEPDIPPIRLTSEEIGKLKSQAPELQDEKIARFINLFDTSSYDAEILTRQKKTADFFEEAVNDGKKKNVTPKQIANEIINKKVDPEKVLPAELIQHIIALSKISAIDEEELGKIIKKVLQENANAVQDYRKGKTNVSMFLVGQVMKNMKEKIDVNVVKEKILNQLNEI